MQKTIEGEFKYEQDSKRFHRFKVEVPGGEIVGKIYVSKKMEKIPEKILLVYGSKE